MESENVMFKNHRGIHALMTADDGSLPGNVTEENREGKFFFSNFACFIKIRIFNDFLYLEINFFSLIFLVAFLANRRQFEIDQYYESIKEHTFKTTFVPIEENEAKAWRKDLRGAQLNSEETILLNNLKEKVKILMFQNRINRI